jgi:23S rRNA C2498 (ribose-2'-O)-methylase RlmM
MEIHDHLRNLLFIRQMNIIRNLLGHLSNNDISHIIVLELIIFVTGFALFIVPDAPIDNAVLVPLIIELQSLFAESFFTQN